MAVTDYEWTAHAFSGSSYCPTRNLWSVESPSMRYAEACALLSDVTTTCPTLTARVNNYDHKRFVGDPDYKDETSNKCVVYIENAVAFEKAFGVSIKDDPFVKSFEKSLGIHPLAAFWKQVADAVFTTFPEVPHCSPDELRTQLLPENEEMNKLDYLELVSFIQDVHDYSQWKPASKKWEISSDHISFLRGCFKPKLLNKLIP